MANVAEAVKPLEEIVGQVAAERPRLLDHWEATALIESLGYTDSRVRREFGFSDTRALGSHVFEVLAARAPVPVDGQVADEPEDRDPDEPQGDLAASVGPSLVYALPWLATFVAERSYPELLALPGDAGPPLSIAIMFSLIVSGGFVQAISRRGQFYLGVKQPAVAGLVCRYFFRAGVLATAVFAAAATVVGWYFTLFTGPYLVAAADQLVVLSVLWLACGLITVRRQHWRVPLAFAAGAVTFVALRVLGADAVVSGFMASAAALAGALAQVPSVFPDRLAPGMPLPRFTVVLFRALPFFWYGTVYFCFLFADRLTASAAAAAVSGAPFGLRDDYKLGMDISLLAFLFGAGLVEYANLRFTRRLKALIREPFSSKRIALGRAVGRVHRRVVALVVVTYVPTAMAICWLAGWFLQSQPAAVWATAAWGNVGYLLFAIGLLNVLMLFSLNDPWAAVKAVTGGLFVNLAVGAVLSHGFDTQFAAAGLVAGALVVAVWSTVGIYQHLQRIDHSVATF